MCIRDSIKELSIGLLQLSYIYKCGRKDGMREKSILYLHGSGDDLEKYDVIDFVLRGKDTR